MLEVDGVSASWNRGRVIGGIAFRLEAGRTATLIGFSGCGKSTLLAVLAGLKAPDRGAVLLDGSPVVPGDPRTGLILQSYGLFPWFSVYRNVELGLRLRGVPSGERRDRTLREIAAVGLAGSENRYPGSLSGGQQQRVAIARTLVTRPRLLLMDEPFSSLDAFTREALQDLLAGLLAEQEIVTILVTHSIDEAVAMGDRILIMSREGAIAASLENPHGRSIGFRGTAPAFERAAEVRTLMASLADGKFGS